jgi:hypothetical protein
MPRAKHCPYCGAENHVYAPQCAACRRSLVPEMPWLTTGIALLAFTVLAYLMFYLMEFLRSKMR